MLLTQHPQLHVPVRPVTDLIHSTCPFLRVGTHLPWSAASTETFALKGRAKSKRALVTPSTPLPHSGASLLCLVFTGPRVSSGSRMLCLPHLSFYCTSCLCCSSRLRPRFHLPLYPVASGKLVSSGPLLSDRLWPNKGAHAHTVHSSASTPADTILLLGVLSPPLLTSLSFCCSTEKPN